MLVNVVEHMLRPVLKLASHVEVHIEINAEDSLELPQRENYRTLCIVNIRDCIGNCCLRSEKLHVRHLLCPVLLLCLLKVLYSVLIHLLINLERLLCEECREICVLYLCHHLKA